MKHDWTAKPPPAPRDRMVGERRMCQNCGVVQEREGEQSWGRVTGYRWTPRAGRCARLEIRGKLGTHSTAVYFVADTDEPPSVRDVVLVRSDTDHRVYEWTEVLIDEIRFGDYYFMAFK